MNLKRRRMMKKERRKEHIRDVRKEQYMMNEMEHETSDPLELLLREEKEYYEDIGQGSIYEDV